MSDSHAFHFPDISIVSANVRVEINLSQYGDRFTDAQCWLGDRVLEDCRSVMPHLTGSLQQRSIVESGGRQVIFPGPSARYLYGGKVMVDSVTGSGPRKIPLSGGGYILRFQKGATLVATARALNYSNPQATDHWFDEAKARHSAYWVEGCKKIIMGGNW